jgi:hypothetical protein
VLAGDEQTLNIEDLLAMMFKREEHTNQSINSH